ncbi:N-acetylated-alpha-linked acidic dipeptidase protein [Dioscorea alata]|uniref:N-acetylated-alpha-linked acidic dipeptidase protein n=1 Tax=Dioscorea alata TaxID=55571 RepID=A0ACB7TQB0_DIOAL|nr:N-acetylated-alpha-linked acidic dipeptidase protein [Dioscorea alata]
MGKTRDQEEENPLLEPPPPVTAVASRRRTRGPMLILVAAFVPLVFHLLLILPSKSTYHSLFLSLSDNATAARHLAALTLRPHLAGTPSASFASAYVISTLSSLSLPTHSSFYDVLLSYPISRSLSLSSIPFDLTQEPYPGDPFPITDVVPTFHAFAFTGTATGPAVYAGFGRVEDFAILKSMGVNVTGTVVLARYGKIYRGDIVKNAQDAGASGAVIYSDKKDYGGGEEGKCVPEGQWMPPSGVQVGSTWRGLGDPTTIGWPSVQGSCERIGKEEAVAAGLMPAIPSLPVSARDGETIQRSIGGQVAPDDWQGVDGVPVYHIGPGPGFLNLSYVGNETLATIENVFAVIEGEEEPDRYVLLGNHRDAWTFGAVDPNSGTAALLEIAQRLSRMQKRGWRPRRTIILCNWDAEEYGLIGSTEWVEEHREMLASRAVAYLNVDSSVAGPGFYAAATPQLDELLREATKKVQDPDNTSRTLYESWIASSGSPSIGRLGGGGSDFASFVQHVGVPSVDITFGEGYPVYHSLYDDFLWMKNFGDPMFQRHIAAASVWGLIALRLADDKFLPFDYTDYASELQRSVKILEDEVLGIDLNWSPLYESIEKLKKAAIEIGSQIKAMEDQSWIPKWTDSLKVRELNDRLMMAERAFTDSDGLFQRTWYKHLVYGPSQHDDYGSKSFPGIDDAIENAKTTNTAESWRLVQHEIWRVTRAITQASQVLNGNLI